MKYVISNSQLITVAQRYILDQLKEMDFKKFRNKDFEFFPKGNRSATHGIEADFIKGEGYYPLVGFNLWKSVMDLFNLDMKETQTAFHRAFEEFGLTPMVNVETIDYYETEKLMGLREETHSAPEWFQKWDSLSRDERVENIEKRKEKYLSLIPRIVSFFEEVYGDKLHSLDVDEKRVHYGNEFYSTTIPNLIFNFNKVDRNVKKEIITYLQSFFNIDYEYYGVPFYFEVYVKDGEWRKV
jgi:hypothetical protein